MKNKTIYMAIMVVSIMIALGVGLLVFIDNSSDSVTLNMGYRTHVSYMPYFIALEQGYFDEAGITVRSSVYDTTNQLISAIVAGNVDATFGGANLEAVFSAEERVPSSLALFGTMETNENTMVSCVMVSADSTITELSELTGMNAATLAGTFAPIWTNRALNSVGLGIEDITIMGIAPGLHLSTLEAGQVDVLFTVEPLCSFGVNTGVGTIIYEEPLRHLGSSLTGSIMSRRFENQNFELAQTLVRIHDKALDFIVNNPDESIAIMAKHTGYNMDLIEGMRVPEFRKSTELNIVALQNLVQVLVAEDALDSEIDVGTILYN